MKASTVEFRAGIGDIVTDSQANVSGTVKSCTASRHDKGYWLEAIDSTGRPFQHYVDERDLAGVDGHPIGVDDRLG